VKRSPATTIEKLLSSEQKGWLNKAREFAASIPQADKLRSDSENSFRRDLFEAACQNGFGALPFSKEYGGAGGDYASFALVNEEFARSLVPIMSSLGVHVLCQEPIYRFGNAEQKSKYLPLAANGKYLGAFGLTEPNAGSDTAAIKTTAKRVGDEYILNGTKTFITSGGAADFYIVMARLQDSGLEDSKSITSFIVERGFQGFEIGQKFNMLGMRGYATCEIVFNDCRVPKANLLGEHGSGRKVALSSLAKGRVTIAAQATGWAQGSLDAIAKFAQVAKEQNLTHHLVSLEKVSALIGDLSVQTSSARALTYQAACAIDRGQGDVVLAAMAKVQATDIAMRAATDAISILGIPGLESEQLVERIFRDAKAGQIYEGTNQIQRVLIARQLFS
jgi:alkylation response protein AidB-like acyl-CoA dehydrogenase